MSFLFYLLSLSTNASAQELSNPWQVFISLKGGMLGLNKLPSQKIRPGGSIQLGVLTPQNISISVDISRRRILHGFYPTLSLGYRLSVFQTKQDFFIEEFTLEPSIRFGYSTKAKNSYNRDVSGFLYGFGLDAQLFSKYGLGALMGFDGLRNAPKLNSAGTAFYYTGYQYRYKLQD